MNVRENEHVNCGELHPLWFVLFFLSPFFPGYFFPLPFHHSLTEKVKYADDFSKVERVFGSLRGFVLIVYHVK